MYDDGYLADGVMIEWLKSHTNVSTSRRWATGLQRHQPLCAGLRDVHRHQAHLRGAQRRRPRLVPRHRRQRLAATLDHAMRNFKDESFIGQYLSPR
jgi:stage V sporulation protein R